MRLCLAIAVGLCVSAAAAEPKAKAGKRPPKVEEPSAARPSPGAEPPPVKDAPCEVCPAELKPVPEAPPPAAPAVSAPSPDAKPRVFVLDVAPQGVTREQAAAFSDAVVASLAARGVFEVVSARDLQTLLGAERQKQLLGVCASDESKCSQDATGLIAARFVLSGQLSRIGSAYQLSLQMVDTVKAQPVGRATRLSGAFEELRTLVPYAAAEATGMPLPPPPSRVLPITLLATGSATAFAGGVVGLLALSRQQVLNEELCPGGVQPDGRCAGVTLRARSYYLQQDQGLGGQKALAVGLLAAGALAVGAGLWLMPPSDAKARLALVPTGTGLSFAGSF